MTTRNDDHDDFGGISRDLPRLIGRRGLLALAAGAGAVALVGCADPPSPAAQTYSHSHVRAVGTART